MMTAVLIFAGLLAAVSLITIAEKDADGACADQVDVKVARVTPEDLRVAREAISVMNARAARKARLVIVDDPWLGSMADQPRPGSFLDVLA